MITYQIFIMIYLTIGFIWAFINAIQTFFIGKPQIITKSFIIFMFGLEMAVWPYSLFLYIEDKIHKRK
jgi:hypothetical protein